MGAQADRTAETRIKVFISYSRADKAFASDLVLGLAACGFAPYIDRQDIAAGEDWEKRLAGLITEADSVVYVISPDSLSSENCAQEFARALELHKRILPVVWRPVSDDAAPPELKRLNYIFFAGEGRTFAAGLSELAAALRTDIGWIREHTRLTELARRWLARGRTADLLLRGNDIDLAQAWTRDKPITAPEITDEQADFIKASGDARAEAERRAKAARSRVLAAVSLVAVAMAGLAAAAGVAWQEASRAEARAVAANVSLGEAKASLEETVASLEEAYLRLNADIGMRFSSSDGYKTLPGKWFTIAAKYSGAVALIRRRDAAGRALESSGFVLDGGLIHPRYAKEALLLVFAPPPAYQGSAAPSGAQTAIADPAAPGADADEIQATFPAIARDHVLRAAERVWRTPAQMGGIQAMELWRLADPLPRGARTVRQEDVDCEPLGPGGDTEPGPAVPLAMFGVMGASSGANENHGSVTLFMSERINRSDPYSIKYTHSTAPGVSGAAVFDLTTGKITAIHVGREFVGAASRAHGVAFRLVLDVMRGTIADARLPPVCGA